MDISLLREQYRCTRERQRSHTQVLLFRTVSEELSNAVGIIPVTPGLMASPWDPNSSLPPAVTFDPQHATGDPWHVHLDLHRRRRPRIKPETTNADGSSRRSSSCSESTSSQQEVTSDSPRTSRETSPCRSSNCTEEEDHSNADGPRGDLDTGSHERSRGDPVHVSVSGSLNASERNPSDGSKEVHPDSSFSEFSATSSLSSSGGSSTPVTSVTCSPSSSTTSLQKDLKENQFTVRKTSDGFLQNSRKFSAPTLRFTRQLSVGGVGSSVGVHQGQNYHPFPSRKTPRISEAARRLGMYSSF